MNLALLNRRQLALGTAAASMAVATAPSVAQGSAQAVPTSPQPIRNGFKPGRFGNVHYRFAQPTKPSSKLPLLIMHASPGSAMGYANFLPLMGTDRFVITPDTPGYGLSDRPPNPSTIADFAGAMGDLLDGLGLKKIDLLGNHTSTATAVELALQRPSLVRRIVLNSALMYTSEESVKFAARSAQGQPADLEAAAAAIPERWKGFREIRSDVSEETAWLMFWEATRDPMHAGWGYAASYAYDFAKSFAQVRQPMLILNPKDVLSEITERARNIMPNARIEELPWTGGTFAGHAAETAAVVRSFLDT